MGLNQKRTFSHKYLSVICWQQQPMIRSGPFISCYKLHFAFNCPQILSVTIKCEHIISLHDCWAYSDSNLQHTTSFTFFRIIIWPHSSLTTRLTVHACSDTTQRPRKTKKKDCRVTGSFLLSPISKRFLKKSNWTPHFTPTQMSDVLLYPLLWRRRFSTANIIAHCSLYNGFGVSALLQSTMHTSNSNKI